MQKTLQSNLPKWVILREIYFALLIWPILPFILLQPFSILIDVLSTAFGNGYTILGHLFILYFYFGVPCTLIFFKHRIQKIKTQITYNTNDKQKIFYFWPLIPIICFCVSYLILSIINNYIIHSLGLVFYYIIAFGWVPLAYLFFPRQNHKPYQKTLFWIIFALLIPSSIGRLTNCEHVGGWDLTPLYLWIFWIVITIIYFKKILTKSILLSFIFVLFLSIYSLVGCSFHQKLSCFLEHGNYVQKCYGYGSCYYHCDK